MKNPKVSFTLLALSLIVSILCSCTTQRKFNRIASEHKDWLAPKCAEHFAPDTVNITVKRDTVYAKNIDYSHAIDSLTQLANKAPEIRFDTVYSAKDCNELIQSQAKTIKSLKSSINSLKSEYKPCEPVIITNTVEKTVVDKAKEYVLQKEKADLEDDLKRAKKQRNWAIRILVALLLVAGVLRFLRVI